MIKPTKEQQEIIKRASELAEGEGLKVFAFAGTGKTTTLKLLSEALPDKKFLYLAFNKSIQMEAEQKMPPNVVAKTTHALAYQQAKVSLRFRKVSNLRPIELKQLWGIDYGLASLIVKMFETWCNSAQEPNLDNVALGRFLSSNDDLRRLYYAVEEKSSQKEILQLTNQLIEAYVSNQLGKLPMTHSWYLKWYQLNFEKFAHRFNKYDFVLLDEAQDTNPVVLSIFEKMPAKKIMVGDTHQKIYGWRGSIDAMERFKADTLYLTNSFRFVKPIGEMATDWLKKWKLEQKAIKGLAKEAEPEDKAILFRTNSKLVEYLAQNLDAVEAGEIGLVRDVDAIFSLPLSVWAFVRIKDRLRPYDEMKHLVKERWLWNFKSVSELEKLAKETEDKELLQALHLSYEYDLESLYNMLKERKSRKPSLWLSTAHTAKGKEWGEVIIWGDFPDIPEEIAKAGYSNLKQFRVAVSNMQPKAIGVAEEINLIYVAITRAKQVLELPENIKGYLEADETELDETIKSFSAMSL